jgi:uncharacterized protein (DUF58 family)
MSPPAVAMESPEKVLRRLEFKVVRRLDGFLFGDYRGLFYGPSLDLAEVREYQPGDEVRRIDWNVTARMNRLYIRQYLEERELTAWLLVDLSPSMAFGTRRHLKREVAAEFAAVAAYIVTRHGDKVGCLAFPGRALPVIPPRAGRTQALRILQILSRTGEGEGGLTDLGAALRHSARVIRGRRLIFLVSDFLAPTGWEAALRDLANHHDVIGVWIRDPAEEELPDVGMLPIRDPETGQQVWVDSSDRRVRTAYREAGESRQAAVREALRRARVDTLELSTASSMVEPLVKFITVRRRAARWRSPGR